MKVPWPGLLFILPILPITNWKVQQKYCTYRNRNTTSPVLTTECVFTREEIVPYSKKKY